MRRRIFNEQIKMKGSIGRPKDRKIERMLKHRLKQGKFSVINAESAYELKLAQFNHWNFTKHPRANETVAKVSYVLLWLLENDATLCSDIWQTFKRAAQKWRFIQIYKVEDIPRRIFIDECDLSYVLHYLFQGEDQFFKQEFTPKELLFLELLCFCCRDYIPFTVLDYYKEHQEDICNIIKTEMIQVHQKQSSAKRKQQRQQEKHKQEQILKESQSEIEQFSDSEEDSEKITETMEENQFRKGKVFQQIKQINLNEEDLLRNVMTRIVERGEKNKLRRRGRPRISEVPKVKELVEGSQDYEQNAYEVVEKMVKHIVRSYAYIYSEMSEKNKKETPIDWFID